MRITVLAVAALIVVAGCATEGDDASLPHPMTTAAGIQAGEGGSVETSSTAAPVIATTTTAPAPLPTTAPAAVTPPTITPAPAELTVSRPAAHARVDERRTVFAGTAPPGSELLAAGRYPVTVADDGTWEISLVLNPGGNVARFSMTIGSGAETEVLVPVFYDPPLELRTEGLGPVHFRTPMDEAMAVLVDLLGPPDGDTVMDRETLPPELDGDEHGVALATGYPALDYARFVRWEAAGLEVMFSDYVDSEGPRFTHINGWISSDAGPHGAALLTAAALGVGATVGELDARYGAALHRDPAVDELSGGWHFSIEPDSDSDDGRESWLHGRFDGDPALPSTRVTTLQAGFGFDEC